MKARIGSDVQVRVDPRQNKGLNVAAGVVTRVNDSDPETVNVRVFLDTGMDLRFSEVELMTKEPDLDDNDVSRDVSGTQQVAWIPPRR